MTLKEFEQGTMSNHENHLVTDIYCFFKSYTKSVTYHQKNHHTLFEIDSTISFNLVYGHPFYPFTDRPFIRYTILYRSFKSTSAKTTKVLFLKVEIMLGFENLFVFNI